MTVICLHQSAELYGSDRSFLQVIEYLAQRVNVEKIKVVLPMNGPLVDRITALDVEVNIEDLCIIRKVWLKKLRIDKIIYPLFFLYKRYKDFLKYDIVYCNTSVIIDFYLLSLVLKKKKIIHIREIPGKRLSSLFSFFINKGKVAAIYNSRSTAAAFPKVRDGRVVYNAFEGFNFMKNYDEKKKTLNLLIIGRISNWKGQDFVLDALNELQEDYNFKLRIVGSPFSGNEYLLTELKDKSRQYNLDSKIEFVGFTDKPDEQYRWADVLIVPSKKPEPFGRIAIEAMSAGIPVLAANHGGLKEIVKHEATGFLFEANNIDSFNFYLSKYLEDDGTLIERHGKNGLNEYEQNYSLNSLYEKLDEVFI
ncbi:hypothetical protein A9P82_05920 [Arachidicoccus ginsenosidimutans]|uniref:glycosyltransferase family 4 protein n=1 Tax=Arachidicoccus sp. BS20 TaxID=1850526 RepID=UPI0007F109FB|nr:glycosyltransferase family 4 protein [Arachidicoccus sp. BS20]ANI88868.1 hypothetical protein A9P82_05920 [Arachidicoccus sp. BS20]